MADFISFSLALAAQPMNGESESPDEPRKIETIALNRGSPGGSPSPHTKITDSGEVTYIASTRGTWVIDRACLTPL